MSGTDKTILRINFIIPKLVKAFDIFQLSIKDSLFIIEASNDKINIGKRKKRAEALKVNFHN